MKADRHTDRLAEKQTDRRTGTTSGIDGGSGNEGKENPGLAETKR